MKKLIPYAAAVLAFGAATLSFMDGATWPGILAALAGILAASGAIWKETEE